MDNKQIQKNTLESRLFETAMNWLGRVDRRDFYQNLVEICAKLLESDVCALYVRTNQINDEDRVCLVAGKLPTNHPEGRRMRPNQVGDKLIDCSYIVGKINDLNKPYDGITGKIATTGDLVEIIGYKEAKDEAGHAGKWDKYVWQGKIKTDFKCMLGMPIKYNDRVIGVIKVENNKKGKYDNEDKKLLNDIGKSLTGPLIELIDEGNELQPAIAEYEYRIPRSKPNIFEKKHSGEILIKHSLTSICRSDIFYFKHQKSKNKLNERLPLVLGHETTGEVYQVAGDYKYVDSEDYIQVKDHVVVIPLIPCETCSTCIGNYGKNYCPSSRFMASNHPGSLRTIYKYHSNLLLKINNLDLEHFVLFTEPMSNVVQMLDELGFVAEKKEVNAVLAPFSYQDFTYFHVPKASFSNIFDTITAEEPNPRTLFILRNTNEADVQKYKINHQNLMVKGLGLIGWPALKPPNFNWGNKKLKIKNPKILILGSGVMAYLLAMLLSEIYGISKDMIVVTGRTSSKLNKFFKYAEGRITISRKTDGSYDFDKLTEDLINQGSPNRNGTARKFDIVFECVGDKSLESNLHLGILCLKDKEGIIAMGGLSDDSVEIDFKKLIQKKIFLKGFYRSDIEAYKKALMFIEDNEGVQRGLERLIDTKTEIRGQKGFHDIEDEKHLAEIFHNVDNKKDFGRLVVRNLK